MADENSCTDCGTGIARTALRCTACFVKRRQNPTGLPAAELGPATSQPVAATTERPARRCIGCGGEARRGRSTCAICGKVSLARLGRARTEQRTTPAGVLRTWPEARRRDVSRPVADVEYCEDCGAQLVERRLSHCAECFAKRGQPYLSRLARTGW